MKDLKDVFCCQICGGKAEKEIIKHNDIFICDVCYAEYNILCEAINIKIEEAKAAFDINYLRQMRKAKEDTPPLSNDLICQECGDIFTPIEEEDFCSYCIEIDAIKESEFEKELWRTLR